MNKRKKIVTEKSSRRLVLSLILGLSFVMVAYGQKPNCKKWTYDFSEVVKYFETPLDACKSYVKEKYPNDNYQASIEPTNDPETHRCSAGETYIGLVYKRECRACCKKPSHSSRGRPQLNL
jgi:hypothetical protein